MPSHNFSQAWSAGAESFSTTTTVTKDGEVNVDTSLAANQTNAEIDIALDVSKLGGIFMSSDAALTIKTNSTGSPDQTIALTAGVPLVWYEGCGLTNPLTDDVTKLYLTNTTAAAAIKFRFLQDVSA